MDDHDVACITVLILTIVCSILGVKLAAPALILWAVMCSGLGIGLVVFAIWCFFCLKRNWE